MARLLGHASACFGPVAEAFSRVVGYPIRGIGQPTLCPLARLLTESFDLLACLLAEVSDLR
ncbi:MAG: hypothetical protein WAK55_26355, partial [Xanthobacteraceae bacterium]